MKRQEKDLSLALWRSIVRQPEYLSGALRINPEITLRTFRNQRAEFLESERFVFLTSMKALLKPNVSLAPEVLEYLSFRIFETYQRERKYTEGEGARFSMDVVFQFLEFLCRDSRSGETERFLAKETSFSEEETEILLGCTKVFQTLSAQFRKNPDPKKWIQNGEEILLRMASLHTKIPWSALESMFYLLVAQNTLAKKYSCDSLLKGWMAEYGFDEKDYSTVANYFPPGTSLLEFNGKYTEALRILNGGPKSNSMDLLLLRSIGNYFSSLLARVATQLETMPQPT